MQITENEILFKKFCNTQKLTFIDTPNYIKVNNKRISKVLINVDLKHAIYKVGEK